MATDSYGAAKELADKIEADGLCCLCDHGENYMGHGEVKVVPFPFDVDRDLIVKALRAYGSHGPNSGQVLEDWMNKHRPDVMDEFDAWVAKKDG